MLGLRLAAEPLWKKSLTLPINYIVMIEPFDLVVHGTAYAIFPEEENTYTIYKEGKEYLQIQKDTDTQWLKLDPESGLPRFGLDEEVNAIGRAILEREG